METDTIKFTIQINLKHCWKGHLWNFYFPLNYRVKLLIILFPYYFLPSFRPHTHSFLPTIFLSPKMFQFRYQPLEITCVLFDKIEIESFLLNELFSITFFFSALNSVNIWVRFFNNLFIWQAYEEFNAWFHSHSKCSNF
jgi:hypothetical protein